MCNTAQDYKVTSTKNVVWGKSEDGIPAAQQPTTRPRRCGGGLVSRLTTQPSKEPTINEMRIFMGMNHLQKTRKQPNL